MDSAPIPLIDTSADESVNWRKMISHQLSVQSYESLEQVALSMRSHSHEYVAVLERSKAVGFISRGKIGFLMGQRYGFAVFSKQVTSQHMLEGCLVVTEDMGWREVLGQAFSRGGPAFHYDILLVDRSGAFVGMIPVQTLVLMQSVYLSQKMGLLEHQRDTFQEMERRQSETARNALHEVAERKRAESALTETNHRLAEALNGLRESRHQLNQQESLRMLGQMASGVAHDFNNALTPILGYSELLLKHEAISGDPGIRRYAQTILTAAKDAAQVVLGLREFYRPRDRHEVFAPVALEAVVEQAVNLTMPKWKDQGQARGATIQVRTVVEAQVWALGLANELRQVLVNLIFNAADAIMQRGKIEIWVREVGERAILEVRDDGIGMTPETRTRCMEPFFTTKGERSSGLGLSMVFGILDRHGGHLEVESQPGQGSTFRVSLPVAIPPKPLKRITESSKLSTSLKILVVDDDPMVLDLLETFLVMLGHRAMLCSGGREALERFHNGEYDLVITDRSMPEMNGDQLAASIKFVRPTIPVILFTGFGEFMLASGERPHGVDLVLSKPIGLDTLKSGIARVRCGDEAHSLVDGA